jgi:hypothetical protein
VSAPQSLPKDLPHNDEDLLEKVALSVPLPDTKLSIVDQTILLAVWYRIFSILL